MIGTFEFNIISFLENDLLMVVAGLAAAATIWLLWTAFTGDDMPEKRLKAVIERREDLRAQMKAQNEAKEGLITKDFLQQMGARFKSLPWLYSSDLKKNLVRAGMRNKEALPGFLLAKLGLPIVLFVLALLLTAGLGIGAKKPLIKILLLTGLPVLAFVLPDIWLKNTIQKREDVLRKSLPDAFDLLVICAEAGLGLDAALDRVSREIVQSQPVLAEEIGITAVELSFLPDRRVALLGLTERVQLPSVRALVNTLVQSEKYGTPLAQALRVLSAELRDERMMKAEEKAAKLPATLTVPMILFILPTLFIVLLGPAIIQVFDLNKN
jgi:tight adherence protein C